MFQFSSAGACEHKAQLRLFLQQRMHHIQQLGCLLDLPVPRGPNKKKPWAGGCKKHVTTAIYAAKMEFIAPIQHETLGFS